MAKRRSSRGRVLVSAKGRINYKNVQAYKDAIDRNPDLSNAQKRTMKNKLDAYIHMRAKENRMGKDKRLTTNGFEAHEANTKMEKLFANVGMSAEDLADLYHVDENELLDPNKWDGAVFTSSSGKKYEFNFSYTGKILTEIV